MKYIVLLVILVVGCNPNYPKPTSIQVTGARLTTEEKSEVLQRVQNVYDCFDRNGFTVKHPIKRVHVHNTCWFMASGYGYVRGWAGKDYPEVGWARIEVEHESASVMLRHSHDPTSPAMICGEPLKREWFKTHERLDKQCEPKPEK